MESVTCRFAVAVTTHRQVIAEKGSKSISVACTIEHATKGSFES